MRTFTFQFIKFIFLPLIFLNALQAQINNSEKDLIIDYLSLNIYGEFQMKSFKVDTLLIDDFNYRIYKRPYFILFIERFLSAGQKRKFKLVENPGEEYLFFMIKNILTIVYENGIENIAFKTRIPRRELDQFIIESARYLNVTNSSNGVFKRVSATGILRKENIQYTFYVNDRGEVAYLFEDYLDDLK